ncbi:unnamed protein product [Schistocephalus solidus]|uniref:Uncharacterized protein n=1 Tax=Schistocephalus solidus TaxID=70667 RepID=A0A183SMH4_SCHSO|nr:unnamed protein product [Schistocephalus solidus]
MPCDERTVSKRLGNVADTAAGRVLVWHTTFSNPFCDSSVKNKLSFQVSSHYLSPSTEPGQKVVMARAFPANLACCDIAMSHAFSVATRCLRSSPGGTVAVRYHVRHLVHRSWSRPSAHVMAGADADSHRPSYTPAGITRVLAPSSLALDTNQRAALAVR